MPVDMRNERVCEALEAEGLDALFLTKGANQRYLEGFTGGDCYMLASSRGNFLIADSRYTEMGARECRTAKVLPHRSPHPPLGEVVAALAKELGIGKMGFERDDIAWGTHAEVESRLSSVGVAFVPTASLVEEVRAVKSSDEAAMIAAACQIADRALRDLVPLVRTGVSELDLKIELDYRMKTGGAEDVSFDTMVLFGARASQPHANPQGDVFLREGDLVLIDYGAAKCGYRSDTTRTFVCGRASDEQRRAYAAVLRAQAEALAMIAPGVNGREVHERAVAVIEAAGFPAFQHGLGHGVGLEIHELPSLRRNADVLLRPGMVVTVEPGIYVPGWGGIRIEDTAIVTENGCQVLTFFPKELTEL